MLQQKHTREDQIISYERSNKRYSYYHPRNEHTIIGWYDPVDKRIHGSVVGTEKHVSVPAEDHTKESISIAMGCYPWAMRKI